VTVRLKRRDFGEEIILVDDRVCGVIHTRFDQDEALERAELYLFMAPDDEARSYCAAFHVSPDARYEMVGFLHWAFEHFDLDQLFGVTQGRLGLNRSLEQLKKLLEEPAPVANLI
jgi:hypothetical protein